MLNQEGPNSINPEQIKRKENYRNQGNDRRVLDLVGRWPRNPAHFRARVAQELNCPRKESGTRCSVFFATTAAVAA